MVFSAWGHIPNVHPGMAVAKVSACGWIGFVPGPPLIGTIGSLTSLRTARFLLPCLSVVIVLVAGTAKALRGERDGSAASSVI